MGVGVASNLAKVLMDLTGETHLDIAIKETIKDALEHRLEKLNLEIQKYEDKYKMTFEEFDKKFRREKIANQYSYEVESDYLDWEGMIYRRKRLMEISPLL